MDSTQFSDGASPCEWERLSPASSGTINFITFFAALREGARVEADKVTFPLSPEEYGGLRELLATVYDETHDAPNTPSIAGQEQLQKLQRQLQQCQHWQISLPELTRLILYITARIRIRPFFDGPYCPCYSSTLGQLELSTYPNETKIHFWLEDALGPIFIDAINKKLQEISSSQSPCVLYLIGFP